MRITDDILYVGVNDHNIDLFEGQYIVPNGTWSRIIRQIFRNFWKYIRI